MMLLLELDSLERQDKNMTLKKIFEEFITGIKAPFHGYVEIYKNPSKKELSNIKTKEIRVIFDNDKKVWYAFDHHLLHSYAAEELKLDYKKNKSNYLEAIVLFEKDKIRLVGINYLDSFSKKDIEKSYKNHGFAYKLFSKDWNWIKDKYNIDYKDYFKLNVEPIKE
jgi:hypothetical protein